MEYVQIKRRVRGKSRSFWWCKHYSAIWSNSREHLKNVFAVNLGHRNNVLENQTRLQNSTDTTRKSLIFRELCALFENNSSGINRDILKHPTWSGAKNSNKLCAPSHLVTCFPRLKSQCVGGWLEGRMIVQSLWIETVIFRLFEVWCVQSPWN